MKKLCSAIALLAVMCAVFANGQKDSAPETPSAVIASTSWTAAFADLAGIDNVPAVAPASLRHPPEYEVTVADIQKIGGSSFFIYAGFERMMKTLGDAVGNTQMIRIHCNNSIANVQTEAAKIAAILHTEQESEKRVAVYVQAITDAKAEIEKRGLAGAKVFCNTNQIYLAKDLGLNVAATFGPGPVTSEQIADAKTGGYRFIIDNVHNPVASPLLEVSPESEYIVWRNFPETIERNALLHVVQSNIEALLK